MTPLENFFRESTEKRKAEGLFRQLQTIGPLIDFCSNDYLGLARSPELFKQIHEKAAALDPLRNGATGSRLLSGNSLFTEEVERKLSNIFKSESTLIFNSGYSANLAVLSAIPQKGDTIIYDELAHASIKDGARLSLARRYSFKHNDLSDLENKIRRSSGKVYIAVESIYSMDGDECPLLQLVALAEHYGAYIVLDEAHSTGVSGFGGNGLAVSLGLQEKIAIRIYTFGKAMGVHGACAAGSKNMKDYLLNFARPFIYTTALPPHSVAAIDCAFTFLAEHVVLQTELTNRITTFTQYTERLPNKRKSNTAIQTVIFPGNDAVKQNAQHLQKKGFDVRPILSPTVAKGSERLRICLHTYNSNEEIFALCDCIHQLTATNSSVYLSA